MLGEGFLNQPVFTVDVGDHEVNLIPTYALLGQ